MHVWLYFPPALCPKPFLEHTLQTRWRCSAAARPRCLFRKTTALFYETEREGGGGPPRREFTSQNPLLSEVPPSKSYSSGVAVVTTACWICGCEGFGREGQRQRRGVCLVECEGQREKISWLMSAHQTAVLWIQASSLKKSVSDKLMTEGEKLFFLNKKKERKKQREKKSEYPKQAFSVWCEFLNKMKKQKQQR